jgi:hypothetical protein
MTEKVCVKCGENKELPAGFYKSAQNASGYTSYCKQCILKHLKEKKYESQNKWHKKKENAEKKEKQAKYFKTYYEKNKERLQVERLQNYYLKRGKEVPKEIQEEINKIKSNEEHLNQRMIILNNQ